MDRETCRIIWKYYADTAEKMGKIIKDGKEDQAPYSLYRAFYEENSCYDDLDSDLISAFFRQDDFTLNFFKEEELSRELGKETEDVINSIPESQLNAEQRQAIRNGLVQPLTLVQGPPGTGKTEMILYFLNVIMQLDLHKDERRSVAIVSCNNEALKNIKDKLDVYKDKDKIFNTVSDHFAVLGRMELRLKWRRKHKEFLGDNNKLNFKPEMLDKYPIFTSTIHSMAKCFDGQPKFDYVIIDECSQVSLSLGLIAMAQAEHLILVGDNLQLQAIIAKEAVDSLNEIFFEPRIQSKQTNSEIRLRLEEESKSFLRVCKSIFPDAPDIMLKKHYRCHPCMAQFCNKYVYDGKLEIMTKVPEEEKNDLRIDITWYDGVFMEYYSKGSGRTLTDSNKRDYLEKGLRLRAPGDKDPSQRCNARQIRIFMEEKLPLLKKKIIAATAAEKPIPSICVMAPFCVQLEVLKDELDKDEELKEMLDAEVFEIEKDPNSDENKPKDKKDNENDLQSLSIHKSQGRSYDLVYLMTVEDVYNSEYSPWGQTMRIINVAVSRAKREFHVITSRIWIPQYIQRSLPEFKDEIPPVAPIPFCIGKALKNCKEEDFYDYSNTDEASREKFFIGKLCKWVYGWYKQGTEDFGEFGFHKAKTHSVFDGFSDIRPNRLHILKENLERELKLKVTATSLNGTNSLAQELMLEVEKDKMTAIVTDDEEERDKNRAFPDFESYLDRGNFLFVCEDNNIKAIVHVLDEKYRNGCLDYFDFQTKLEKYISKIPAGTIYVQIPTNGSLGNEIEAVRETCRSCDECGLKISFEQNRFTAILNGVTKDCLTQVKNCIKDLDGKKLKQLDIDYRDSKNVGYTEIRQKFYFCRYGTAYAFEYALIYDLVFRNLKSTECNILSLGCGSCVDAFSAAYSRDFCGRNDIALTYHGVDCLKWDVDLLEPVNGCFDAADTEIIPLGKDGWGGILGYFLKINTLDCNVIFFPKIINELKNDTDTKKKLIEAVRGKLNPDIDEYFFCFSHSKSNCENPKKGIEYDITFVTKLIESLNCNGDFEVNENIIYEEPYDEHYEEHAESWRYSDKVFLIDQYSPCEDDYPFFCFKVEKAEKKGGDENEDKVKKIYNDTVYCYELNPDFRDIDTDNEMDKIIPSLNKEWENKYNETNHFRYRIKAVNTIAYFQIIHLTGKKKED